MSEDQVTHTPTPWYVRSFDEHIRSDARHWSVAEAYTTLGCSDPDMDISGAEARANAEFIVLAVNSHDALTTRVAELEAENERLRSEPNSIRQEVIAAWEALPGGYHDLGRVQMWMMDDLYPVIQKFRAALKPGA